MYKELVNSFQVVISKKDKKTDLLYLVMIAEKLDLLKLSVLTVIHQTLNSSNFSIVQMHSLHLQDRLLHSELVLVVFLVLPSPTVVLSHSIASESLYHVLQQQGMLFDTMLLQMSLADGFMSAKEVLLTEQNIS